MHPNTKTGNPTAWLKGEKVSSHSVESNADRIEVDSSAEVLFVKGGVKTYQRGGAKLYH